MKRNISALLSLALILGLICCMTFTSSAAEVSTTGYIVSVWDGISSAPGMAGNGTEAFRRPPLSALS